MILRGLYGVWIIGCVACLIAFMSVFFSSRKTVFKSLLDTSLTPGYLSSFQAFSYRNLDTSSTPGGLIEKVHVPSIASRHLVDRSSLISYVWCFVYRHFLDTCICRRPNPWHLARHSLNTFICRALSRFYVFFLVWSEPHFSRSLSR